MKHGLGYVISVNYFQMLKLPAGCVNAGCVNAECVPAIRPNIRNKMGETCR